MHIRQNVQGVQYGRKGAETKGPFQKNGLYKVHVKLRQVLKQAYRDGEIPSNPADMVDFPKPPQENKRNSLTLSEARRFRKAILRKIETEGDAKYVGILIILGTGCRRGEMLGLSWGDIDFASNTITFYNQYAKDKVLVIQTRAQRADASA